MYVKTEV